MTFAKNEAGWNVIIGENGSGKTTVLRSIALALIGPTGILRLDPNWDTWLTKDTESGSIDITTIKHSDDLRSGKGASRGGTDNIGEVSASLALEKSKDGRVILVDKTKKSKSSPDKYFWAEGDGKGWFSAGFGPFRRFTGGNETLQAFYVRNPRIGAHLTVFKEEAALTEVAIWIRDVYLRSLEKKENDYDLILKGVGHFINMENLLPEGFKYHQVNADGMFFMGPDNVEINLNDLSEGIKSVLSLALEIIRLMVHHFGAKKVFLNYFDQNPDNNFIPIYGVVLIDEIDAHLHPSWQTRIGQWFTRVFRNVQFIVATHSPLICRACENGSIWRLAAPGSNQKSGEINGAEKDILVFGDILDAYDTEIFGTKLTRGEEGRLKQEEYRVLVYKENYGLQLSTKEKKQLKHLKSIFHTDVATDE